MSITIRPTLKSALHDIKIIKNQLVYCTDTKECYYDVNVANRIQLGCTIQIDDENTRIAISNPLKNRLYIVVEDNKLYRFVTGEWIDVTSNEEVLDLIAAAQELVPTTIIRHGVKRAPKTIGRNVYLNDGRNVEEALKDLENEEVKTVIFTRTEFVVASHNHQKIFNIPFPVSNYDLKRFPIIVIAHGRALNPDEYDITEEQVILKYDKLNKDEIVTFIFNYTVRTDNDTINATSINNVRLFIGDHAIENPREDDTWIDTYHKVTKQYRKGEWINVIDPGLKPGAVDEDKLSPALRKDIDETKTTTKTLVKNVVEIKDSIDKLINRINASKPKTTTFVLSYNSNVVPLDTSFNSLKDTLLVFRNSIFMDDNDYYIDETGKNIVCANDEIWMGSEEPITFNFLVFKGI